MNAEDPRWMQVAIENGERNPQAPFGAVIVNETQDKVLSTGFNQAQANPTLHGEIVAINNLADSGLQHWHDLTLYTTAEPCCMCQSAILWAGISRVVYGTSVSTLTSLGWNQFELSAEQVTEAAPFARCEIIGGVLEQECDDLFKLAKSGSR